jgi:hypothetical protein
MPLVRTAIPPLRQSPRRISSDTGGPSRFALMTCNVCHQREGVIFMVDATMNVRLRLCEPCDRQRRQTTDTRQGGLTKLPLNNQPVGGNIIRLTPPSS